MDVPLYVYGETKTSQHLPNDILRELHGFIHMFEDTPEFVARHIIREAKSYLDSLAPPFFRALVEYAQDGSYSWHCPGHSGGVAFLKSPVGQMFHQFFGENMLRADVCNAVDELGQLLDHSGPVAASERNAARIFNVYPRKGRIDVGHTRLALALTGLREDLGSLDGLTDSYMVTVEQAETTIADTESSLAGTAWLLRAVLITAAVAGLAVGSALIVTLAVVVLLHPPALNAYVTT